MREPSGLPCSFAAIGFSVVVVAAVVFVVVVVLVVGVLVVSVEAVVVGVVVVVARVSPEVVEVCGFPCALDAPLSGDFFGLPCVVVVVVVV
jgi:hypothetical protein